MRKVYIVVGSTGEYSDHQEWYVSAYLSEVAAASRVKECQAFANELWARRNEQQYEKNWEAMIKSGPDPRLMFDYTGTRYSFAAVDLVDG